MTDRLNEALLNFGRATTDAAVALNEIARVGTRGDVYAAAKSVVDDEGFKRRYLALVETAHLVIDRTDAINERLPEEPPMTDREGID